MLHVASTQLCWQSLRAIDSVASAGYNVWYTCSQICKKRISTGLYTTAFAPITSLTVGVRPVVSKQRSTREGGVEITPLKFVSDLAAT